MDRTSLTVTPRDVIGKKVKQLRHKGLIPGHMYGYQIDPLNVSVEKELLEKTYTESGETGLIDLQLDGKSYPVLIQNIQRHALSGDFLNVDFYKVNLKEKVTVSIPVIPQGEPIAVASKVGILEQPLSEVEIEALPTDLIELVEVDVTNLAAIDDALYVKDLHVPQTVTIVNDTEEMVFKIGPLMTAEMEETLQEAEEAAAEAQAEAEGEDEAKAGEEGEGQAEEESEASDDQETAGEKQQED